MNQRQTKQRPFYQKLLLLTLLLVPTLTNSSRARAEARDTCAVDIAQATKNLENTIEQMNARELTQLDVNLASADLIELQYTCGYIEYKDFCDKELKLYDDIVSAKEELVRSGRGSADELLTLREKQKTIKALCF